MGRRIGKDEGLKINMQLMNMDVAYLAIRAVNSFIEKKYTDCLFEYGGTHTFHVFRTRAGNISVMEVV